jgi:tetratricopeptide (TPR) repeat protein
LIAAREEAVALVDRYPDDFHAHMFLGNVCRQMRDVGAALASLEQAGRLRPEDESVAFNTGACQYWTGELEKALAHFLRAAELAPEESKRQPSVLAGYCHHRLGRPKDAIPVFERVLQRDRYEVAALYGLMQALRDTGEFDAADAQANALERILGDDSRAVRAMLGFFQAYDFHGWLQFDDKAQLKRHIDRYRQNVEAAAFANVPETYVMPDDYAALEAAHRDAPGVWVVKPNMLHNGHGLRLVDGLDTVPREPGWLVQRYLADPFLFRGRKANFRIFLLVTAVDPPRVYLFHGGSARFALEPYRSGPEYLDHLPMHIGNRGLFSDRADLVEETNRVMGNADSVWGFRELIDYIAEAGFDTDALWSRLRRQAEEVVGMFEAAGVFRNQVVEGCRHAYGPKILGLDIFFDDAMRPWLLEIERGPTFNRMFNGERDDNPVLPLIGKMVVFPLGDGDPAEFEYARRGPFIRLLPAES